MALIAVCLCCDIPLDHGAVKSCFPWPLSWKIRVLAARYVASCFILSSRFGCERATVVYHEHRRMFSVYDSIARSQPKRDERMKRIYPNLVGKCPRGAECPHSHKKDDAAEYIKMLTQNLNTKQWLASGLSPSISALVAESAPGNALRI